MDDLVIIKRFREVLDEIDVDMAERIINYLSVYIGQKMNKMINEEMMSRMEEEE